MSKTIVITGASDGIGAAAAKELARQGNTVVVVGRSPGKTKKIAGQLGADYYVADFSDLQQVRDLAAVLKKKYKKIDVLANNAGGLMDVATITKDGFSLPLQVNYLAPFLLTYLLMDTLMASKAVIINTSSAAHKTAGTLRFDALATGDRYGTWNAYGATKLLNILFTKELARRYGEKGIKVAAFHPGVVRTSFGATGSKPVKFLYSSRLAKAIFLTPEQGADTLEWLASSNDWKSGDYFVKRKAQKPTLQAYSIELSKKVWDKSLALLGL